MFLVSTVSTVYCVCVAVLEFRQCLGSLHAPRCHQLHKLGLQLRGSNPLQFPAWRPKTLALQNSRRPIGQADLATPPQSLSTNLSVVLCEDLCISCGGEGQAAARGNRTLTTRPGASPPSCRGNVAQSPGTRVCTQMLGELG